MAKNECGYLGHRTFKLAICYKGINQNKVIFFNGDTNAGYS